MSGCDLGLKFDLGSCQICVSHMAESSLIFDMYINYRAFDGYTRMHILASLFTI